MSEYTKDEALWWAINQMRRAAKVLQIAGIMIQTDPSYEEIYAKGLNQCADECETVMEPSELERLRRETFPNGDDSGDDIQSGRSGSDGGNTTDPGICIR
jgi:hypothetical protein